MAKVFVSEKQIISIEEFMNNYIQQPYDGKEKLTHHVMEIYLMDKCIATPTRANFKEIRKEDLARGNYICVKDNNNQVLIYKNPRFNTFETLLFELNSSVNKRKLEKIRTSILNEMGYVHDKDGTIIEKEQMELIEKELLLTATEKVNRLKYVNKHHY